MLRAGCSYRQRLEDILAERGVVGVRLLEFGMLDAIIGCAAAGIGITLLPRAVVEAACRAGRIAAQTLPAEQARVTTVSIRRSEAFVSAALDRFLWFCRKYATDAPPAAGSGGAGILAPG